MSDYICSECDYGNGHAPGCSRATKRSKATCAECERLRQRIAALERAGNELHAALAIATKGMRYYAESAAMLAWTRAMAPSAPSAAYPHREPREGANAALGGTAQAERGVGDGDRLGGCAK